METHVVKSYEVRVLGPLPENVRAALEPSVLGAPEARTVLRTSADDAAALSAVIYRLSGLGLELAGIRRDRDRTELELGGPVGPCLRAAFSDVAVARAGWRCVVCLRTSARSLLATLQLLTEQGVDLLSVRVASPAPC